MKRLFVFVPAILLVIFLVNSFVLIEKKDREKTNIVFKFTDGGQTWQEISKARPDAKAFMTSIAQIGENFIGVHNDGILRSSDKGKT